MATLEHVLETKRVVDSVSGLPYEVEEYVTAKIGNTDVELVIDIISKNNNQIKGIYHISYNGEDIFRKAYSEDIVLDAEEEVSLAQELANGLVMKELPLTTGEKFLRAVSCGLYPPKKEIDPTKVNFFSMREAIRDAHCEFAKHYTFSLH